MPGVVWLDRGDGPVRTCLAHGERTTWDAVRSWWSCRDCGELWFRETGVVERPTETQAIKGVQK